MTRRLLSFALCALLALSLLGCGKANETAASSSATSSTASSVITLDNLPAFADVPYVELYDNEPSFTKADMVTESYESYADLDSLGRCGVTMACIGRDIMPTEERGAIGQVKPTGWHTVKYDGVDGKYLYNRCHLIGYQLTGENANVKNLITGTRYLNVDGMLPFENLVADYVKETGNHVLYRVTPVFHGSDLVATGVEMEAYSVEDKGEGVCFHVYCYNNQPGIDIDYATGDSHESGTTASKSASSAAATQTYVLNTGNGKFHLPECASVKNMSEKNKKTVHATREAMLADGYEPCQNCHP